MNKIQNTARIISNEKVCPKFYHLCLEARPLAKAVRPGQFFHIRTSDALVPFFRRPFSVFRAKTTIEILYEVVGKGTKNISLKKKGDLLDVMGPLGNSFSLPPQGTKQVVMIAGGVGIAPFLILSDLLARKIYKPILLYGARSKGHVFRLNEFTKNGCRIYISTNDGSVGQKGYVSTLFPHIDLNEKKTMVYACGPRPMLATVQTFARLHRLPCEASCEEVMACGLGACLGCSIQTTQGYKTVCHDGPVFNIHELKF
ncbi:MAG: dihydroorotate dehydrogenase electron transfer subunit [Candidatus Omnitrophota bacterium]